MQKQTPHLCLQQPGYTRQRNPRDNINLQPSLSKPRRNRLSLGRLLRKLRSGKVGYTLPGSSSEKSPRVFRVEGNSYSHVRNAHLQDISSSRKDKSWKGLSFRVMVLEGDQWRWQRTPQNADQTHHGLRQKS